MLTAAGERARPGAARRRRGAAPPSQSSRRLQRVGDAQQGPKKRHVEEMTRLPTKRMATACWDFIVFKSPLRKASRGLDFSALQGANTIFVHRKSTKACGRPGGKFQPRAASEEAARPFRPVLIRRASDPRFRDVVFAGAHT